MTVPGPRCSSGSSSSGGDEGGGKNVGRSSLTRLPTELLVLIAEFLQFPDILSFAQTNRRNLGACANGITRERELLYKYRHVYLGPCGGDHTLGIDPASSSSSSSLLPPSSSSLPSASSTRNTPISPPQSLPRSPLNLYRNIYTFFEAVSEDARYNYVRNIGLSLDPVDDEEGGRDESHNNAVGTIFMSTRPPTTQDRALCRVLESRLETLDLTSPQNDQTSRLLARNSTTSTTTPSAILPNLLFHATIKANGEALFAASMPIFTNLKTLTFTSRVWDGPHYWDHIDSFFQSVARESPQKYLKSLDTLIWDPCTSSAFQNIRSILAIPSLKYARLQGCHERNDDDSAEFAWPEGCPVSNVREIVMRDPRISKAGVERVLRGVRAPCVVRVEGTSLWRQDEDTRWRTCTKICQADGSSRVIYA